MSIYRRERLRERLRVEVQGDGRSLVTDADFVAIRDRGMGRSRPSPLEPIAWPVLAGAYRVVDPLAPVAICTLASERLIEPLSEITRVSIVGRALTENLGVEKVILNILANPVIHTLVVCGVESRHGVGDTIRQLYRNGVDAAGRVVGASGPLPILPNLQPADVNAFQHEIALVDLVDETSIGSIRQAVEEIPTPPSRPRSPRLPQASLANETGSEPAMWAEDPAGFVLLSIGPWGDRLVAELYTREAVLRDVVQARSAEALARAVVNRGGASTLEHAEYIGRECARAEVALAQGWRYEQDQPFEPTP